MDKDFLLKTYGQCYDAEAGPWNLSLANKYLEYMFARFYEEHFPVPPGAAVCNIGIGAGYWDRYLSYRLNGGTLTSIDVREDCCRQLEACLENERNPNPVRIICADVLALDSLSGRFDIVTAVGSTCRESGGGEAFLERAVSFLKPGGSLYLQTLGGDGTAAGMAAFCQRSAVEEAAYLLDERYGFWAEYWKLTRTGP